MTFELLRHYRLIFGAAPPVRVALRGRLGSGATVQAVYIGSGINQAFLTNLIADEAQAAPAEPLSGYPAARRAIAQALAAGQTKEVHAVLTDLPPLWRWLTPAAAQFCFPAWMRQSLLVPQRGARWVLPRAVEREAARLARRHGYHVQFTHEAAAIQRFFSEQYRPYVQARFAAGAVLVAEAQFMHRARGAALAQLWRAGEWTAGMLLHLKGARARFGWFGASSHPPPPGAAEVLDVACAHQAQAAGARYIELGHSRPLLSDGVVRYKARLGARIHPVRYPQHLLAITLTRPNPQLLHRLRERQLITIPGRPRT